LLALPAQALPDAAAPEPANAAGASTPDPLLNLLRETGLLSAAAEARATPVIAQVRDAAGELVLKAMGFLGVPYRRGGASAEAGFDCSGFTRHVFEHSLGLVLPRRAAEQARDDALFAVRRDELRPGDLVFFNTLRRAFSHVGIYIGDGKFIHAPRAGGAVRVEDMREAYWQRRFNGARRVDDEVKAAAAARAVQAARRDHTAQAAAAGPVAATATAPVAATTTR
jgi:cell wall-associated NlpC family hydrolase